MNKRFSLCYFINVLVLTALFLCCSFPTMAEVFKPLQIILPGNFQGKSSELAPDLKITPGLCWRIPETIEGLKRNKSNQVIVFATGNDSSLFSPLSFFSAGKLERNLINLISPDSAALSQNDIEVLGKSLADSDVKSRIWTNFEPIENHYIFKPFVNISLAKQKLFFFNFISPQRCRKLPAGNWGQYSIDNPARSIRRLAPQMSDKDYSISLAYLDKQEAEELASELKHLPGYHFLIHVPEAGQLTFYPVIFGEQDKNLFKMALMPGHSFLPVLNIFSKNFGAPRMTLRMLPLAKGSNQKAEATFSRAFSSFSENLKKTHKVILTSRQASTSAFAFNQHVQADILKKFSGCDIGIIINPQMQHFNDNVIAAGHILTVFKNSRIRKFRLTGSELLELLELLFAARGAEHVAFSGFEASYLAGQTLSIKISGQNLERNKTYLISTTEDSLNDILIASFLNSRPLESYDGLTFWQVWLNGLKSLKISESTIAK